MPYAAGVYTVPPGTEATTLTAIDSSDYNAFVDDIEAAQNAVRPIVAGGTGGSSASDARTALGAASTNSGDSNFGASPFRFPITDTSNGSGWSTSALHCALDWVSSDVSGVGAGTRARMGIQANADSNSGSNILLQYAPTTAGTMSDAMVFAFGTATWSFPTGLITVGTVSMPASDAHIEIGNVASATAGISLYANSAGSSRTHVAFENPNGVVGSITTNGSATTYATSSDYRLKDDVTPLVTFTLDADDFAFLPDALRLMMLVDPVSYIWRNDPGGPRSHGFIAHELQKVFPHAVSGEKDAIIHTGTVTLAVGGDIHDVPEGLAAEKYPDAKWVKTGERIKPQGVDYSKLVTDLTAALQALTVIVMDQKKRLEVLESGVANAR